MPSMPKLPAKKAVAKKAPVAKKAVNKPQLAQTKAPLPTRSPEAAKPPPEPIQLKALSDQQDKLRYLIYADPGTGKSTGALRAAQFGPVVVIDADRGLRASALKRQGIKVENVQVHDEIEYDRLEQLYFELKAREDEGNPIFALVIDSITMAIPWMVEHAVSEGVAKAQKLNRKRDVFDIYVEDYGTMTEQLRKLIVRRFMTLDCHIIITAHPSRDKDENGGVRIGPDITPALGKSIKGAVDCILFMETMDMSDGSVERWARTSPIGIKEAKDRLDVLPHTMVEPSFDRILAYAEGDLTEETDPLQGQHTDYAPETVEEETDGEEAEEGDDQ